ncbi:MAG: oligosaccharide flippase family protein [Ferruginibacter sp.]
MSGIKNLAGQTMWYGVSSIAARLLNYLLTPYLTLKLAVESYGEMSLVYAAIPFLNILFTYGIETGYFRFVQQQDNEEGREKVYNTGFISLLVSTIIFTVLLFYSAGSIASFIRMGDHPEFIKYSALIIALDTITTLPFALLRQQGRPIKFAVIRVTNILVNIGLTYFFISILPGIVKDDPNSIFALIYKKDYGVGYVILANLVASAVSLLMLRKEIFVVRFQFDKKLWKQMMIYSLPLIIAGLGGMINETFDRIMLGWWAPVATADAAKFEVGVYSACYKLSILISLFIQAFRMGAEPFFFKQAAGQNAQRTYARVMKFFVITITVMFLVVALYLDLWKYFIRNKEYWAGLKVVPVLLFANMFLGIYYNLSVWYKLTGQTLYGAYITLAGAAITLVINFLLIPHFSYVACAWATFACYGAMMVMSYVLGQKHYRIPYATKKLVAYMVIVFLLFVLYNGIIKLYSQTYFNIAVATVLLGAYLLFIARIEKKEFAKLPLIGKYFVR